MVEGPDPDDNPDDLSGFGAFDAFDEADFDEAARRFMERAETRDAPHEPSYAERVRASRQNDLQRRLADAAEHDRQLAEREAVAQRSRSRAARVARFGAPMLIVAIVGVAIWLSVGRGNDAIAGPPELRRPTNWPSMDKTASTTPLGTPPPAPAERGDFTFMSTYDDKSPVTWDPCRPIRYVVNPAGQPVEGAALIQDAFVRAASATGLSFVDGGTTTESWTDDREPFQPDRYGDRWAPILIVWADGTTVDALSAPSAPEPVIVDGAEVGQRVLNPAGVGGPVAVRIDKAQQAHVSGKIALDVEDLGPTLAAPGGRDRVRAVIQHEVGHVLGLGHVDDPTQLMYKFGNESTEWGSGDLHGLRALATGDCRPEI